MRPDDANEADVRSRVLSILLALYVLIALTPAMIWLTAVVFDRVDDGLRDALGLTAYALPIALGLAAVTLAFHGLAANAAIQDDLDAELDDLHMALAGAGASSASGGPAAAADEGAGGASKTARTGPKKRGKGDRFKRRAQGVARAQIRRKTGF